MTKLNERLVHSENKVWVFSHNDYNGESTEWIFNDSDSCNAFARDFIEERARDLLSSSDDEQEILRGVLDQLYEGDIGNAAIRLGEHVEESYDWDMVRPVTYSPRGLKAMKDAIDGS